MAREYVTSTSVSWFAYEDETATLEIAFKSGGTYRYFDVTEETVHDLRYAPSTGTYVNETIKPHYRCERINSTEG